MALDAYERRARLAPAYIVLAPAIVAVVVGAHEYITVTTSLASLLVSLGVPFLLVQPVRDRGKAAEPKLYEAWGGAPATAALRATNDDPRTPQRRQRAAAAAAATLPSAADQERDSAGSDLRLQAVIDVLIRERNKDTVLRAELADYGLRCNLYGVRVAGTTIAAIVVAVAAADLVVQAIRHGGLINGAIMLTFSLVALIGWSQVRPDWVRKAADRYAHVARHGHGTGLSRVLPRSWDHPGCQSWDHRRVVRRFGRGLPLAITSSLMAWRSRVAFREVRVHEVREVLRHWLADGVGLRTIGERAGVDRKTARRYVEAAIAAGLVRECGEDQLSDELIGAVVAAVRPARVNGHGAAWESLLGQERRIRDWIENEDLQLTNIHGKLTRLGVNVPYRTLHRFAVERCGFGRRQPTVRVADGEPGVECQLDFARLGLVNDPESGRRRVVHALIFTAVYSRHMFVWLTFRQTLDAVIAGCEAAWAFFGGVFKVLVPENVPRNIFRVLWPVALCGQGDRCKVMAG